MMSLNRLISRNRNSINSLHERRQFSSRWKAQRDKDVFADRAIQEGLRSRAAYKLEEINRRHGHFLRPGTYVLDLGAAPGGFSVLASRLINLDTTISRWNYRLAESKRIGMERMLGGSQANRKYGRLICVDRNEMNPITGATFLKADIFDTEDSDLLNRLVNYEMDVVLSDMAPDTTGEKDVNHARIMELAERAFHMCHQCLRNGGTFVCKIFSGDQETEFRDVLLKRHFTNVKAFRPKATRKSSPELYYVARGYVPAHMTIDIDNIDKGRPYLYNV